MNAQAQRVDVVAGPYRVCQQFRRGRNLPRYILIGRGNVAVRTKSGRTRSWASEADATAAAAALAGGRDHG
jgi:hypothetical protein